jgi:hypothetical protein
MKLTYQVGQTECFPFVVGDSVVDIIEVVFGPDQTMTSPMVPGKELDLHIYETHMFVKESGTGITAYQWNKDLFYTMPPLEAYFAEVS